MSVRAIDVGFDLRRAGPPVDLSKWAGEAMPYDGPDGPAVVSGTRDEVATALAKAGYAVVTAHTPQGREVRCEPEHPDRFLVQPPHDNYWVAHSSTDDALEAVRLDGPDPGPTASAVVVTRHPGLVEHLKGIGLITDRTPVIEHATADDVKGKDVIGVLPLHLAAEARTVTEVPMRIPAEMWGVELTPSQVAEYAGEPVAYRVERLPRSV